MNANYIGTGMSPVMDPYEGMTPPDPNDFATTT